MTTPAPGKNFQRFAAPTIAPVHTSWGTSNLPFFWGGRLLFIAVLILPLTACQSYSLTGRVVQGNTSSVSIVNPDDPRMNHLPLANATIQLIIDPKSLNRTNIGTSTTDDDGNFSIPIKQFGAGFLEYELSVLVRSKSHSPAFEIIPVPPAKKRLLITLAPGKDRYQPTEGPLEQAKKYLNK